MGRAGVCDHPKRTYRGSIGERIFRERFIVTAIRCTDAPKIREVRHHLWARRLNYDTPTYRTTTSGAASSTIHNRTCGGRVRPEEPDWGAGSDGRGADERVAVTTALGDLCRNTARVIGPTPVDHNRARPRTHSPWT